MADDHILQDIGVTREDLAALIRQKDHETRPGRLAYLIAKLTDRKFS